MLLLMIITVPTPAIKVHGAGLFLDILLPGVGVNSMFNNLFQSTTEKV